MRRRIVAIGESLEASIMATMYAKDKGVKTVIAKAIGTPQKKLLEKVGADKVLMPERDRHTEGCRPRPR